MNIPIAAYTYALSSICASIQLIYYVVRNIINQQNQHITLKKLKQGNAKSYTNALFLLNQILFTGYNILGLVISYNRGYVIYRSVDLTTFERSLQIFEVLYESLEKSILFASLILFLPVFKLVTKSYMKNFTTKQELDYVVIYIVVRGFLYPATYFLFYKYPMLSLFIIGIMNISEGILLSIIFSVIGANVDNNYIYSNPHCERTKVLMRNLYYRFGFVCRLCITQLILEIIFKICIITFTLMDDNKINQKFFDFAFLFRLVSFSMQSYALTRLSDVDETKYPDNIFWTPSYNEDFIFFDPYEDKKFIERIGEVYNENVVQPNGASGHRNASK